MTLASCVAILVARYGLRGLSRETGVDSAYISRMMSGERNDPSADTLMKLGILREVSYRVLPKRRRCVPSGNSPAER